MIHLNHITWQVNNQTILQDITTTIQPGSFTILVGANGTGKTSLLDIIAGKKRPTTGNIYRNDIDITHYTEHNRAQFISRLFQNPSDNTATSLTVAENIAMANVKNNRISLRDALRDESRIIEQVTACGFSESILHRPVSHLSGGQRQRIAFIMATAVQPDILLLDEPTAALDTHNATQLLTQVLEYQRTHNVATIMVTHDPQAVEHLDANIWWLRNKQLSQWTRQELDDSNIQSHDIIGSINYSEILQSVQNDLS